MVVGLRKESVGDTTGVYTLQEADCSVRSAGRR